MRCMARVAIGVLTVLVCGIAAGGCGNRSLNEKVLGGIQSLQLVQGEGITFAQIRGETSGGTGVKLAYLRIAGNVISTGEGGMPANLADQVADVIRAYL